MKLKLLSLLLIAGMMMNVGCTSSNSDESADIESADGANSELADEGTAIDADSSDEGSDVSEATDEAGDQLADDGAATDEYSADDSTDDFASDEEVVADTGDEVTAEDGTATEQAPSTDDVAAAPSDELPADSMENTTDQTQIVAEDGTANDQAVSEAPAEEGVFDSTSSDDTATTDTSSYASTGGDTGYYEAPKYVPVKKIADAPYTKNGVLINTVYLARQGDTLKSIATKVGVAKSDLSKANPNLSNGVKVGDKVYYNSPKRPQDSEKMLTYYEDNGIAPQTYVAKAGDNIRAVSKDLLGDKSSWKEVWATNLAVESKSEIPAGTELRYWTDGAPEAPAVAAAPAPAPEAPQMPEPTPEAPVAANDAAAPAAGAPQDDFALPDDMAQNGAAAAGTVANAEPPPPPPPPPAAAPQKTVASNDEKDLTFMLSAGGLLLVGVGVLLGIIRKGRSRKMSMNTHTQI